jgi:hypothetical protein
VPWLKTVVKHEAFAFRRQRDRHTPLTDDGELRDRPTPAAITHDQAERYERLRQAAEALGQLKPQEIRALQLKAEGYSYREICQLTGWTLTKVSATPELSLGDFGEGRTRCPRCAPQASWASARMRSGRPAPGSVEEQESQAAVLLLFTSERLSKVV